MIKFHLKRVLALCEKTQKQLLEETGIRPPTISAIAAGTIKHMPIDVLNKICICLNCQPNNIMEYIPNVEEQNKN